MEQPEDLSQDETEEEMEQTVSQCVRLLLDALYLRIDRDETKEEFDMELGGIRIMTDPDGAVGKRVAEKGDNKRYASFFACVATDRDAYELELRLVSLAVSPLMLATLIKSMEPDYQKPDYAEGLEEAIDRVSDVLFKAVVIPFGSPMYIALHKSASRVQLDLINKTRRTIYLSVKTISDADKIERMLMTWAGDVDSLKDVIAILQPDYYEPRWHEDLQAVATEIADVLSRATVIEPTSQRHVLLSRATKRLPWTTDC